MSRQTVHERAREDLLNFSQGEEITAEALVNILMCLKFSGFCVEGLDQELWSRENSIVKINGALKGIKVAA